MEPVDDTAQPLALGELLARERERLGLSRLEIAQRLHMSAFQVEALEMGDYERLPKGTFLRGFVRNYAKQLGVPAEPLLARLHEDAPRPPPPGIVVASQNIRFDPMSDRLSNPYVKAGVLAVVAIALAFAAMYWWLFIRTAPIAGTTRKSVDLGPPQQVAVAPMAAPQAPAVDAPRTQPTPSTLAHALPLEAARGGGSSSAQSTPSAASTPAQAAAEGKAEKKAQPVKTEPAKREEKQPVSRSARDERVLKFRFRGESWVEIRDVQGKVLLSRLNLPGSEAEVSGRAPLSVVVGNAPDVRMTSDERDFPLEPHTRVAVARFTVE